MTLFPCHQKMTQTGVPIILLPLPWLSLLSIVQSTEMYLNNKLNQVFHCYVDFARNKSTHLMIIYWLEKLFLLLVWVNWNQHSTGIALLRQSEPVSNVYTSWASQMQVCSALWCLVHNVYLMYFRNDLEPCLQCVVQLAPCDTGA